MVKKEKILNWLKKIFKNRLWVAAFIVLVVTIGFLGWRVFGRKSEELQLQTALVERGIIVSSVSASGQVLSVNIMSANTKASGIVKKVYVKDGDVVKKGEKILEIDLDFQGEQKNASAWSSYLSAKNTLESAKATQYSLQATMFEKWDTFRELAESSNYDTSEERALPEFHIPEKEWLAAEAKYKNQEAMITQAQVAVNSSWLTYVQTSPVITAPIDGVITSLMFAEGMNIGTLDTGNTTSNQKVATIKTEGMPIVSVNLSEIDVSEVKSGQKATLTLDSMPDKTFTGKVVSVDRVGVVTSGVTNYPVIIRFDTSSEQILSNMTATAEIIVQAKENVLWVPPQAIRTQAGQTMVRVLVDGKPQEKQVEVGLETSSQAEVVSGLSEGETIIISEVTAGEEAAFEGGGFRGIMPGMGGRQR